jgi:hypothetical protein
VIEAFLRLFSSFRRMEEAYREQAGEILRFQDRLEAAQIDRGKLWDTLQEALRGERTAYQTSINHAVQRMGGGVPYPDAHSLPPNVVPRDAKPEAVGSRMLPSEAVARQTQRFVTELVAGSKKQAG